MKRPLSTMDIPVEIWLWIAQCLGTMGDWFNFCCTCQLFAAIGRDQKRAAKRRLARHKMLSSGTSYSEHYELANGHWHGLYACRGGVVTVEVNYVDDLREGVQQKYDKQQGLLEWGRYHEGANEGQWFEQSQIVKFTEYSQGQEIECRTYRPDGYPDSWKTLDSLTVYHPNGATKYITRTAEDYASRDGTRCMAYAYDEEGRLQSTAGSYEKGSLRGWLCIYHNNGCPKLTLFYDKHGDREGHLIRWHDNGQPCFLAYCHSGFLEGKVYNYRRNGTLQLVVEYKRGERHGLSSKWGKSGTLQSTIEYCKGKRHGLSRKWSKDGTPQWAIEYHEGKRRGLCCKWNKKGELVTEEWHARHW